MQVPAAIRSHFYRPSTARSTAHVSSSGTLSGRRVQSAPRTRRDDSRPATARSRQKLFEHVSAAEQQNTAKQLEWLEASDTLLDELNKLTFEGLGEVEVGNRVVEAATRLTHADAAFLLLLDKSRSSLFRAQFSTAAAGLPAAIFSAAAITAASLKPVSTTLGGSSYRTEYKGGGTEQPDQVKPAPTATPSTLAHPPPATRTHARTPHASTHACTDGRAWLAALAYMCGAGAAC